MKLMLWQIDSIIQQEVAWCEKHKTDIVPIEEAEGFIKGLKQALFLIITADASLQETESDISNEPQILLESHGSDPIYIPVIQNKT
jgi:hypothetical protein